MSTSDARGGLRSRASTTVLGAVSAATDRLAGIGLPEARALGATAEEIARETSASKYVVDGRFVNLDPPAPPAGLPVGAIGDMVRRVGHPSRRIPVRRPDFAAQPRPLAATWLGHATALVELDGVRILTDPVFSRRASPSQHVGPARMHAAPIGVADLPPVDVVLISHDHYDHLDTASVIELARTHPGATFVCPLGVGAHLRAWGIGAERIRLADWHGEVHSAGIRFVAVPARHFSGRGLERNNTLWASWAAIGPQHRMFFSGDTGFSESFDDVGAAHGPFHLTLIAIGAYDPLWADIHVNPEEALTIHRMLTRETEALLLPLHWGTFNLARHKWGEPAARLSHAAQGRPGQSAADIVIPQPGGDIDVTHRTGTALIAPDWWKESA
ncbi:MAG: MBL fold metallo-hydrolase [Gordonia sp. (in: high G+C Gram-positive bacteria)]|uniref:MBL fold metallo-hydrolase n=1 Tax=Gordonia sp. (in: high G+C Gram-positive bacteria) TaxID=84139 RepID=UPI0039E3DE64